MPPSPSVEEALMIEPPPFAFIVGTTACMPSQQPSWLTRHSSSTSSTGIDSTEPKRRMPALLASTLTGPNRSLAPSTTEAHEAASLTSWATKCALSPSSSARVWPSSLATSAMTTRASSATNARTIPAPWPIAPPVTMAVLPVSRPMVISCVLSDGELHDRVGGEAGGGVAPGKETAELAVEVGQVPDRPGGVEPLLHHRRRDQRHHAAVDDEDLAGDPLGGRRGEVGHQRRDVVGRVGVDLLAGSVLAEDLRRHRGAGPRADRVGPHPDPAQTTGAGEREGRDARLGGGVVGLPGRTPQERLGSGVDDPAVHGAIGLLRPAPPVGGRVAREQEVAAQVHADHVVPLLVGEV